MPFCQRGVGQLEASWAILRLPNCQQTRILLSITVMEPPFMRSHAGLQDAAAVHRVSALRPCRLSHGPAHHHALIRTS